MKKISKMTFMYLIEKLNIYRFSDEKYIKEFYKYKLDKKLNLDNPKDFNEKLQWLKINDRNPEYTKLVDKYEVKQIVSKKIGEEYIIPTIGIYNSFEEINFDKLPEKFVIKCTHDSGGLAICKDKRTFDIKSVRKKINYFLKKNHYYYAREWPYKDVHPRIIIEDYMQNGNDEDLRDYKFYCFNGIPQYLYVSEGLSNHETAKIDFYDMNYEKAPFGREDYLHFDKKPSKPINFEKMKDLSRKLSKDIPFVRVDFYEINGKIYFGELTFTPCGGFMKFYPEEWDRKLGDLIKIDEV